MRLASAWLKIARSALTFLVISASLPFLSLQVKAQPIIPGYESYLSRPDALKVTARPHPELGKDWEKIKRAQLEAVAMILEMYPDQEIYFLARDSELLYDLARWTSKDEPATLKRLHLLNVSRANMEAEHIRDYLAQEGIGAESLTAGKKVLLVDTGFSGTIPKQIQSYFPANLRSQIKTHLMSSTNPSHPSSRVFLTGLSPVAPYLRPSSMHGTIIGYEHIRRFTDRSNGFLKIDGKWLPISPADDLTNADGSIDKEVAQKYQQDLLYDADSANSRRLMSERRAQWRELKKAAQSGDNTKLTRSLKQLLIDHPKDPFVEAMVRDSIEMAETGFLQWDRPFQISLPAVGLEPIQDLFSSNKDRLIKNVPEWTPILKFPDAQIPKLIDAQEFGTLGSITDVVNDENFYRALCNSLGYGAKKPGVPAFIEMLIEKGDPAVLFSLAQLTFSLRQATALKDTIRKYIEKAGQSELASLAHYLFSQPHAAEMQDLARLVIEKGDANVLRSLKIYAFSQPYTANWTVLRDSLSIENPTQRIAFLNSKLGPMRFTEKKAPVQLASAPAAVNAPLSPEIPKKPPVETKPIFRPISATLSPGDAIETLKGRKLSVIKYVDQGIRGVVYQVKDSDGTLYALKVAINSNADTLKSIANEPAKAAIYKKYHVNHAQIVEAQPKYVLKNWIDGTRADNWINQWLAEGRPRDAAAIKKLRALVHSTSGTGVYIGDLNPKNLIWDGKDWVVIDSGGITENLPKNEALSRYLDKIPRRWSRYAKTNNCPGLIEELQRLLGISP